MPLPARVNLLQVQGIDNSGAPLAGAQASLMVTNLAQPALRPLVINEWMAGNAGPGGFPDGADGKFKDWFELYNPNSAAVDVSGWFLTDTLSTPLKWAIPSGAVVSGNGFLLVWADSLPALNGAGVPGELHAGFQLNDSGEAIGLFTPDGALQHGVSFGPQIQNVSQGLFPDGNTNSLVSMPDWSPGAPNRLGLPASPRLSGGIRAADGLFLISVPVPRGRACQIEYTDDLSARVWVPMTLAREAGGSIQIADSALGNKQRFYRVVLLP